MIGSVFDSTFATQGGSAYRFKRTGNLWSQDSEFSAGDIANFNHFGYAIAASGVTVVVGAPLGYFFEEGATYVFESPNTAPVADSQAVTATEDTPLAVALAGSDAEGDSLNFIVLSNPTKGTLSGAPPGLIYTPAANMNGSDSFTFKANDGSLDSEPATVSITITPVNDGPSISDIPGQTVTQNSSTDPLAFTVSDVDNDPAALIVTGSSDNPALVPDGNIRFGGSGANRTVTVAPAANQTGTATIQVTVSDGLATAGRTFTLTVTRANLPPVADASASPTTVIAPNNMNASVTLQGSRSADPDGDSLTYRWYSNGDLSTPIGSGMSSTVILGTGTYNITLVVNDGVATDSDTVLVTVLGASQAIDRLIDEVGKVDAPPGQKKDLISGLQRAQQDVQRGDYGSAANELVAAQNKIADWSGKRIAPATAQSLIQEIQHIIDALPLPPNATQPPPKGRRK